MSKFEFATAQRIIFGNGASKDLYAILAILETRVIIEIHLFQSC
jgi:hypothetical protein